MKATSTLPVLVPFTLAFHTVSNLQEVLYQYSNSLFIKMYFSKLIKREVDKRKVAMSANNKKSYTL